jgi:hypothetical protein
MDGDDRLALAIAEWQRRYGIADNDPMIAMLDLVRIHLQHAREIDDDPDAPTPPFEDFRSAIELLDQCAKTFTKQASQISSQLGSFARTVERFNRDGLIIHLAFATIGIAIGFLIRCYL